MQPVHFRPTHGAHDAAALLQIHTLCHAVDGSDPLSLLEYRPTLPWYQDELACGNPADWTIAEASSTVVGYGHTLWDWAERDGTHVLLHVGWVAPAWRGQGIGTALLARLEARCREKAAGIRAIRYEFGANASAQEQNACEHLEAAGYMPGYTLWEMEHNSNVRLGELLWPEGYDLRPVEPDQYRAIWQCIGDAYDVSRPGGRFAVVSSEEGFRSYFTGESADPTLWFVAWQGSHVAGQALCRVREHCGEVFEVSVGYGHRRRGLARALLICGLEALRARGVPVVRLYTVYENPTAAWQLYEQVGFRKVGLFPRWRKAFALPSVPSNRTAYLPT